VVSFVVSRGRPVCRTAPGCTPLALFFLSQIRTPSTVAKGTNHCPCIAGITFERPGDEPMREIELETCNCAALRQGAHRVTKLYDDARQ
jgi:hypothetical protein